MKWREMYGKHEIEWTMVASKEVIKVDLFKLGHILWRIGKRTKDRIVVCHAVSDVCEIVCESQQDTFDRYLKVVNSVHGQGRTQEVLGWCRQKKWEYETWLRLQAQYIKEQSEDHQLEMRFTT